MISVEEMRGIEKRAAGLGIEERILMENAGSNACRIADGKMGLKGKDIIVFCGTGNNAGDGLVFARHALVLGASVKIYFVKGMQLKEPAMGNLEILRNMGKVAPLSERLEMGEEIERGASADVLIDAMLGIGLKGTVEGEYAEAIRLFGSMNGVKISLDCPSGVDCDTGSVMGTAVKPDITITFHDRKRGLNRENSGEIIVADIGIPEI